MWAVSRSVLPPPPQRSHRVVQQYIPDIILDIPGRYPLFRRQKSGLGEVELLGQCPPPGPPSPGIGGVRAAVL